ncbi:MAG: DUF6702 family protein [Pyrinomonadaceae bacterium]
MKKSLIAAAFTFVITLVCLNGAAIAATAHRYHASLTRMDYNSNKKLVEVTVQLFTHDLVPILEKQNMKQIDLEKTEDIDKLLLDYLNVNLVLKNKDGEQKPLNWVGKEINVDSAYIYVEIPMPEGLEKSTLKNTIFFEMFDEQTNRVTIRRDKAKTDVLFRPGDKFKDISFAQPKGKR